jgi:hypothetical protein
MKLKQHNPELEKLIASDPELEKLIAADPELEDMFAAALRSLNLPWELLLPDALKAIKRAKASRREAKKVNESRREKPNWRKQTARAIIERLIKTDSSLRLPRKQTKLAECVQARWPKHDDAPAISTLRHWLAEMRPQK